MAVVLYATLRYDATEKFNVDWKAGCGQLNLAHVTKNKKMYKKKKLKQASVSAHLVRSVALAFVLQ